MEGPLALIKPHAARPGENSMANANIIQVYSRNRERLAFLQNAFAIGYKKTLNSLWTASFSMPADDPKNAYCRPFNLVELYDGDERVELFRIVGEDLTRSTQATTVYNCEHVLATLIDDVMFQYHQIGNLGVYTPSVIRYVLDRQTENNWKLGICGFSRQFEYKCENENLLSALFSIAKPFTEPYIWDFDTSAYPWTLNLRPLSDEVKSEIRYGKNMAEVTKTVDATNVITRLYCLGYGEGDNQLDIRSVNNGVPYLDAPTISAWGIKASILAERRFEDAESLKAYGQQILNAACKPYVTYSAQAVRTSESSMSMENMSEILSQIRTLSLRRCLPTARGKSQGIPSIELRFIRWLQAATHKV
jgi:phage minor structural protein